LAEIGKTLDEPHWDLRRAVHDHLELLDRRQALAAALQRRLSALASATEPTTAHLLQIMEDMAVLDDDPIQRRISILVYDDLAGMYDWLIRVFGLGWAPRPRPGRSLGARRVAGRRRDDLAAPGLTPLRARLTQDAGRGDGDHRRDGRRRRRPPPARHRGGGRDRLPAADQPYGYREYGARDPEGGLWSFMKPLD
jgi:MerR family transcriptional regulator, thiopeptide resistance regulator